MPDVSERILEQTIRHQVYLQGLSKNEANKAKALLKRTVELRIAKRLAKANTARGRKHLLAVLRDVKAIIDKGYDPVIASMQQSVANMANYEIAFQISLFHSLPIDINLTAPSPNQIAAAVKSRPFQGRLLREVWKGPEGLKAKAYARARDTIRQAFIDGTPTPALVREFVGTKALAYKNGQFNTNKRAIEAVVRTALNHTAATAKTELYKANTDIIKQIQWVSTLDSKTSLICAGLDGRIFDVDKPHRIPPAHFNCRSTTIPVVKSFKELGYLKEDFPEGTRSSFSGQVPAKQTFDPFLRNQDNAFQETVLGKKRAKLFRDGKLNVRKFTDRNGNTISFEQLRKTEADAFERAGL